MQTIMRKIILLLLSTWCVFSCNQKEITKKYLGIWENVTDSTKHFKITQSRDNFILKYFHSSHYDFKEDKIVYKENETIPVFYDKSKDKLLIKWNKGLDAIYDNNTNQIVIESWGAFKKLK